MLALKYCMHLAVAMCVSSSMTRPIPRDPSVLSVVLASHVHVCALLDL